MKKDRFTAEDWLAGKTPVDGRGAVESMLGLVAVNVEAEDERDRHFTRQGRARAGKRRDEIFVTKARGKAASAAEIVAKTRFVASREVRMPLPDKRKVVLAKDTVTPVDAQAILSEDRTASVEARLGVFRRVAALRDSQEVDALLNDTRE